MQFQSRLENKVKSLGKQEQIPRDVFSKRFIALFSKSRDRCTAEVDIASFSWLGRCMQTYQCALGQSDCIWYSIRVIGALEKTHVKCKNPFLDICALTAACCLCSRFSKVQ